MKKNIESINKNKAVREMIRLDKMEKSLEEERVKINNKRWDLKLQLRELVRIDIVVERALELRKKALANEEINAFMKKHNIPIESLALVEIRGEYIDDYGYGYLGDPKYVLTPDHNTCYLTQNYIYGGANDPIRAFFKDCHNGRYILTGYQFKFPEKQKRDWKATFKKKAG